MRNFFQTAFSDLAIFFYNPCGGDTIAVLWKPIVQEALIGFDVNFFEKFFSFFMPYTICRFLQPNNINGRKYSGHQSYGYNLPQLIEDFRIMGRGLVENIVEC